MRNFLTILVLFVSVYCSGQNLKITIYNKTGYDVDSVYLADTYVGSIKKEDTTVVLNCKKIEIQGDWPFGFFEGGVIKDKPKNPYPNTLLCGTGMYEVTTGDYNFDILITWDKEGYYKLKWGLHNFDKQKKTKHSHHS